MFSISFCPGNCHADLQKNKFHFNLAAQKEIRFSFSPEEKWKTKSLSLFLIKNSKFSWSSFRSVNSGFIPQFNENKKFHSVMNVKETRNYKPNPAVWLFWQLLPNDTFYFRFVPVWILNQPTKKKISSFHHFITHKNNLATLWCWLSVISV